MDIYLQVRRLNLWTQSGKERVGGTDKVALTHTLMAKIDKEGEVAMSHWEI